MNLNFSALKYVAKRHEAIGTYIEFGANNVFDNDKKNVDKAKGRYVSLQKSR